MLDRAGQVEPLGRHVEVAVGGADRRPSVRRRARASPASAVIAARSGGAASGSTRLGGEAEAVAAARGAGEGRVADPQAAAERLDVARREDEAAVAVEAVVGLDEEQAREQRRARPAAARPSGSPRPASGGPARPPSRQPTPARRQSWTCRMPAGRSGSAGSVAKSVVILLRVHHPERLGGQRRGRDGARRRGSSPPRRVRSSRPSMCRRRSPSVTMPTSCAGGVDHADDAEALAAHLDQRLGHRRVGRGQRHLVAGVHQVADRGEPGAEPAARVQAAEVLGREARGAPSAPPPARRRAPASSWSRWSAPARPSRPPAPAAARCAMSDWRSSVESGSPATPISGMREAPGVGDEVGELGRLAGVREQQHHVVGGDHAEIAVARLGRVDEERRACRSRRGSPRSCARRGRTCPCPRRSPGRGPRASASPPRRSSARARRRARRAPSPRSPITRRPVAISWSGSGGGRRGIAGAQLCAKMSTSAPAGEVEPRPAAAGSRSRPAPARSGPRAPAGRRARRAAGAGRARRRPHSRAAPG